MSFCNDANPRPGGQNPIGQPRILSDEIVRQAAAPVADVGNGHCLQQGLPDQMRGAGRVLRSDFVGNFRGPATGPNL